MTASNTWARWEPPGHRQIHNGHPLGMGIPASPIITRSLVPQRRNHTRQLAVGIPVFFICMTLSFLTVIHGGRRQRPRFIQAILFFFSSGRLFRQDDRKRFVPAGSAFSPGWRHPFAAGNPAGSSARKPPWCRRPKRGRRYKPHLHQKVPTLATRTGMPKMSL